MNDVVKKKKSASLTTIDPKLEIRAVCSIFESPKEVAHFLLAELEPTYFGYKPAKLILKRALTIFQKRGSLPKCATASQDVALPEQCQIILSKFKTAETIPTKTDAEACLESLKHWRKLRKLFTVASLVREAFTSGKTDEDGLAELASSIDQEILSMKCDKDVKIYSVGKADNTSTDQVVEGILYGTEKRLLPSGFEAFDRIAGGWARGNLIILAASSGGGKSTVAMQSAINVYLKHNKSPAIISLEMDEVEYFERVLSCISGVEYESIRTQNLSPGQLKKIETAWKEFRKHGKENNCVFTVFPVSNLTSTEMRARLVTGNYDYWYIDYLNLLNPDDFNGSEAKQLGDIARFLKNTAKDLGIACVALTQISDDFRIKYSRAVREHANFVLKWQYDEDAETSHMIKVVFDKGRASKKEDFYLIEDFPYMTVKDHSGPAPERTKKDEASNVVSMEGRRKYKQDSNSSGREDLPVRRMKKL